MKHFCNLHGHQEKAFLFICHCWQKINKMLNIGIKHDALPALMSGVTPWPPPSCATSLCQKNSMCQVWFTFLLSHTILFWSKFHIPQHMPQVAASLSEFFVTADDWSHNIATGYSGGLCLGMLREGERKKIKSIIQFVWGNEKELQWFLTSLGFLLVGLN